MSELYFITHIEGDRPNVLLVTDDDDDDDDARDVDDAPEP